MSFVRERDYDRCDDDLPDLPMRMHLKTRIAGVKPCKVGTFITSVMTYHKRGTCIATSQMVALILGLAPDMVIPFTSISANGPRMGRSNRGSNIVNNSDEFENDKKTSLVQYQIPKNPALLYRLSGD
jgi:hypothetical protein